MEYLKIINLLDNITNLPSKVRTRNWVAINDESRGKYDNSRIKFKTSMIGSDVCDYSDAFIFASGTITITGEGDGHASKRANKREKEVIFKNCAPFTKCISSINNTQIDNAEDIDLGILMYDLLIYSDNYSKTSGTL